MAESIEQVFYGEVSTCAGHAKHGPTCNCQHTVNCLLQRLRSEPHLLDGLLAEEGLEIVPISEDAWVHEPVDNPDEVATTTCEACGEAWPCAGARGNGVTE